MKVIIYTTTNLVEHTEVDRIEECGSFLCVFEGGIVYRYNISYVTHVIQLPESNDDLQPQTQTVL